MLKQKSTIKKELQRKLDKLNMDEDQINWYVDTETESTYSWHLEYQGKRHTLTVSKLR